MKNWNTYIRRYQHEEWRTPIFRDMVLEDARAFPRPPTVLDIGCGDGFDDDLDMQKQIASAAGKYIGIEPDPEIQLAPYFTESHRCLFEDAPIAPGSIDLAFSVMVLEHLPRPELFWQKLWTVLAGGGVFWGFTVDARHWFCKASLWFKRLRVKELYLDRLHGQRGVERYHNYPVYYRANRPEQILPFVKEFRRCDFVNFAKVGQMDYYLPPVLRPVGAALDRSLMARRKAGAILAVRVEKG
jgi:SAM-dependent methyltransferase